MKTARTDQSLELSDCGGEERHSSFTQLEGCFWQAKPTSALNSMPSSIYKRLASEEQ